jgi:hypothetical protein
VLEVTFVSCVWNKLQRCLVRSFFFILLKPSRIHAKRQLPVLAICTHRYGRSIWNCTTLIVFWLEMDRHLGEYLTTRDVQDPSLQRVVDARLGCATGYPWSIRSYGGLQQSRYVLLSSPAVVYYAYHGATQTRPTSRPPFAFLGDVSSRPLHPMLFLLLSSLGIYD